MVSGFLVMAGWAMTPLLVFVIGGIAVRRQVRRGWGAGPPARPAARLEELRRESARQPHRGRMAEALRLAEAAPGAGTSFHAGG
ncbi:hypothetical protein [Janibacter corallicola]|uniref:hypothetical protein n=1 Tax=Janibacter corallicola TaxID=415212 RepID=UPI00082E0209|nr:hypothetical protein [Janibacter corallicola]